MTGSWALYDSPVGELLLTSAGGCLTGVYFEDHRHPPEDRVELAPDGTAFVRVITQLDEYFSGSRDRFDLPLAPAGTEFQQKVWNALLEIPFGATESYGDLAARLGDPKATRAVGLANGKNPISIIVPCHRVVGADGSLTGYGGGLERKRWLLVHEGALLT